METRETERVVCKTSPRLLPVVSAAATAIDGDGAPGLSGLPSYVRLSGLGLGLLSGFRLRPPSLVSGLFPAPAALDVSGFCCGRCVCMCVCLSASGRRCRQRESVVLRIIRALSCFACFCARVVGWAFDGTGVTKEHQWASGNTGPTGRQVLCS